MTHHETGDSGWNNEITEFPEGFMDDLPQPLFWRLLVAPMKPKEVSKGGIVLALQHQEAQDIMNFIGRVVAVGPQAGVHERLGGDGKTPAPGFPTVGDYIAYGRFAGQRLIHKGVKLLVINDDEILTTVPNPDTLQVVR